jgi:ATP-dependent RNA helicase RhlE
MKMTGRATSFVTFEERDQLRAIETLLGHAVPLAEGSLRPSDRTHSRMPERSRGDRQRWGGQTRTDASISRVPRRTGGGLVS